MFFYKKATNDILDTHSDIFLKKMVWLKDKWSSIKEDSEETRLMHPFIADETTPINLSIIADNVDYFQKHYKETPYKNNLEKALARACLCGSQQIGEFLLKKLKRNYISEDYTYLLGYVAASMNIDWAQDIAFQMAKANKDMPKSVFGLAEDETIDILIEIFKKAAPSQKKN